MRWEQYEVWVLNGEKWELAAFFADFDVAAAVHNARSGSKRLIYKVFQDGQVVHEDILAELRATREHP